MFCIVLSIAVKARKEAFLCSFHGCLTYMSRQFLFFSERPLSRNFPCKHTCTSYFPYPRVIWLLEIPLTNSYPKKGLLACMSKCSSIGYYVQSICFIACDFYSSLCTLHSLELKMNYETCFGIKNWYIYSKYKGVIVEKFTG